MNRFTEMIHDKGMIIKEFCEYWGIHKRTYQRMCADEKRHDELEKMIRGVNKNHNI